MDANLVGWAASTVLIATLCRQIYTQWKDDDAQGVSRALFVGQIAASIGFIAYSWMLRNWVFIVTNSITLVTAVIGQIVISRKRRSEKLTRTPRNRSACGHLPAGSPNPGAGASG